MTSEKRELEMKAGVVMHVDAFHLQYLIKECVREDSEMGLDADEYNHRLQAYSRLYDVLCSEITFMQKWHPDLLPKDTRKDNE